MIKKWKKFVVNSKTLADLLTNLPETFDYLPHDLIIVKLNTYGVSLSFLDRSIVIYQIRSKEQR